jgi:Ca2+-transporting ATPase
MGAWRLSRSRILTRRAAAIETLGAATVLCTDKTGTLTRNVMSVVALHAERVRWDATQPSSAISTEVALSELLRLGVLASDAEALDPMERALKDLARAAGLSETPAELIRTYPLTPQFLAVTQVWRLPGQGEWAIAAKGAPEAILRASSAGTERTSAVLARVDDLAASGMRVLAVAQGRRLPGDLPDSAADLGLQFVGLIGLADPLRESVPLAVQQCREAGIRVIMITGDYPHTARAIARQAGIVEGTLLTGDRLEALDDQALRETARTTTVFARIRPHQKLRIVEALKAEGEVVAMTGDGVNDAPALKAAHIGIAMGGRGTDVAREAASLVLLDDDFGSIVLAVRLGRRIYDNLRKAFAYIVAIHIPIAGLALVPILFGDALLLTPMLIAFLELIIDPACSIVLEAEREEPNTMRRPPRDPHGALISRALLTWSVLQGAAALLVVVAAYVIASARGLAPDEVRTLSFVALLGVNVALIFSTRTFGSSLRAAMGRPNRSLLWGLGAVVTSVALVLGLAPIRGFFGLGSLRGSDLLLCLSAAASLVGLLAWFKRRWGARLAT